MKYLQQGQKVRINLKSEYKDQGLDGNGVPMVGVVRKVSEKHYKLKPDYFYYYVDWEDGSNNSYRPIDLEIDLEQDNFYDIW